MEPPETPAHLFPFRALRTVVFGTPGPDADEMASQSRPQTPETQEKPDIPKTLANEGQEKARVSDKISIGATGQANASPTKSILATPGTTSNRRKTVSFGEGVVDNERKRDETSTKLSTTPAKPPDNTGSQWSSGSSGKPPSRLMQTLLHAREEASQQSRSVKVDGENSTKSDNKSRQQPTDAADDDTVNLNEPRSQSGKYWKAEFENYRINTNKEIKKLIQYRRAAKLYAKKKDEEASRLAAKIREEESKVAEMESRVSQLASTMVGEGAKADKEQLIQELTKQTALALQYKHQVKLLRKSLEQHGVVDSEIDAANTQTEGQRQGSSEKTEDLHKTQRALGRACAKVEEMKRQQEDLERLQDLVQSSEKKASALEKENSTLKQTIARYKQEMTKYEGRRKEREAKLKQRETRVEARFLDCRERLRRASHQHRESEEALKKSFHEERRRMQEQIDLLRLRISAIVENFPHTASHDLSYDLEKGHRNIQTHDFDLAATQGESSNDDDDYEPLSPSPRSKVRGLRHSRVATADELDMRRVTADDTYDGSEHQTYFGDTPGKTHEHRSYSYHAAPEGTDIILPSSPPNLPPVETSSRLRTVKQKRDPACRTSSRQHPSLDTARLPADADINIPRSHHSKTRGSARPTFDGISGGSLTGMPIERVKMSERFKHQPSKLEKIPPEQLPDAFASLRRETENRKSKQPTRGKENLRTVSSY